MWLSVLYFDTRWDWTARAIARELVYQAGASPLHQFFDELFGDEPVILTELNIQGADYAACYYRYRDYPYIVIQKGSAVLRVNLDIFGDTVPMEPEVLGQIMADSLK